MLVLLVRGGDGVLLVCFKAGDNYAVSVWMAG